jgi:hypothetical protein
MAGGTDPGQPWPNLAPLRRIWCAMAVPGGVAVGRRGGSWPSMAGSLAPVPDLVGAAVDPPRLADGGSGWLTGGAGS